MGIPPELIATEKILTYQKNMLEFCRHFHDGRPIHYNSLHGTLDMLRLNLAVLEALVEEREGG